MTPRPVRILTMVDTLMAGGAERMAVELACALDRTRFEPHVLVTRGVGPLEDLLIAADVPYTVLNRTRTFELRAWRRAHKLVRAHDLVHSHKFGSNVWGALLARSARRPLVTHEHNFAATGSRKRAAIERFWIAPATRRVLCVSNSVAQLERDLGVPGDLLAVVPNGVRVEAALPRAEARAELGLVDDAFVIGMVGRLRPEKAHEVMLDALRLLVEAGRDLQLCVVGDGPREDELRAMARQGGLLANVVWAGERRDAARLAGAFDLSVICSHWEGMPLAALESMAAGVPLVATAVGGLVDLLGGDAGSLVAPADAAGLAGGIAQLVDDPELGQRYAATARQRVHDEYSFERMVTRIEGIYTAVLDDRAGENPAPTIDLADHDSRFEAA